MLGISLFSCLNLKLEKRYVFLIISYYVFLIISMFLFNKIREQDAEQVCLEVGVGWGEVAQTMYACE
jgi:hypothetical protein